MSHEFPGGAARVWNAQVCQGTSADIIAAGFEGGRPRGFLGAGAAAGSAARFAGLAAAGL